MAQSIALSEVFAETLGDAGAMGFTLSQIAKGTAPILWIQDRMSRRETGRPYLAGLGVGRSILLLDLARPADVLVAAEEGLRCKALMAVVAEIWGDPPALNFTATKRLALRAEVVDRPCWLIRHGGTADLSAARDRWRIASLPSAPNPDDAMAPGDPRWRLELFRSRDKQPAVWVARHEQKTDWDYRADGEHRTDGEHSANGDYRTDRDRTDRGYRTDWEHRADGQENWSADGEADRLHLSAAVPDGAVAEDAGTAGQRALR